MNQFDFEFIVTKNYLEKITNITNVQHDNVLSKHKCQLENEPATYSKSVFFYQERSRLYNGMYFTKKEKKIFVWINIRKKKKSLEKGENCSLSIHGFFY